MHRKPFVLCSMNHESGPLIEEMRARIHNAFSLEEEQSSILPYDIYVPKHTSLWWPKPARLEPHSEWSSFRTFFRYVYALTSLYGI